ncbi:hypothetical protein T440DRAFT_484604 [Plenodomus tracheiphilus IPT5]|uniref:Uncharacterized protein n=1 Tax=Plenodomus tracheiphilus IPT5 TaxID=1408161 RepID=A0A6A7ANF3_9PLEO|nr:hypothetical protein T440DRAFT_484604 [Plenodomus tracheiphilus IPT5]
MGSRRLTIFPSTGHVLGNIRAIRDEASTPTIEAARPKLYKGNGPLDVNLSMHPATSHSGHKTFTPINGDPGQQYRCMHIVDPEGERPYCLAQEIASHATEHAYRVVMIRRGPDKPVVGLARPNPNLLNIVSVFQFQSSIFTVFDRPGFPLSEIAVSHSPQLGLAETLPGISALSAAGLYLSSVNVEDITISANDGQVKLGFDKAILKSPIANETASAFGIMLEDLVSRIPGPLILQQSDDLLAFIRYTSRTTYEELQQNSFLKNSLPAPSLIPFVLNAQIIVLPVEHVTEAQITDLKISSD